jgi:hypothetical protein
MTNGWLAVETGTLQLFAVSDVNPDELGKLLEAMVQAQSPIQVNKVGMQCMLL